MTRGFKFMGAAAALAVVVLIAFGAAAYLRDQRNPTAASPTPVAAATSAAPSSTATATTTSTATPTTSAAAGSITGVFRYPAGFYPALTTYAISVANPSIYFSVSTSRRAEGATSTDTSPVPGGYRITGVAPGTYYVVAYRDSDPIGNPGTPDRPGLYSQYSTCTQPPTGATCTDHTLIAVTVGPGATVTGIDPSDWNYEPSFQAYPARPPR